MEWPTTQKEIEKKIKEQQRYIKQISKQRIAETTYHESMTPELDYLLQAKEGHCIKP